MAHLAIFTCGDAAWPSFLPLIQWTSDAVGSKCQPGDMNLSTCVLFKIMVPAYSPKSSASMATSAEERQIGRAMWKSCPDFSVSLADSI